MPSGKYDPEKYDRRSIRLRRYDYASAGAYFVTVCTQDRRCMFGKIENGVVRLNEAGRMVEEVWNVVPDHYPGVETDAFVVMPNHVHAIIFLVGATPCGRPHQEQIPGSGQTRGSAPTSRRMPVISLGDVVRRFKTITMKKYVKGVKHCGWIRFDGRLWQRNYFEHIIRNEKSLNLIREYIVQNPLRWEYDRENPDRSISRKEIENDLVGSDDPWRV
jgi:putative transposase